MGRSWQEDRRQDSGKKANDNAQSHDESNNDKGTGDDKRRDFTFAHLAIHMGRSAPMV
jgi:hypothetical protein